MTNIEYLLKNKQDLISSTTCLCELARMIEYGEHCEKKSCKRCPYFNKKNAFEWLLEEYVDPIILTKWEYDLLLNCTQAHGYSENDALNNYWIVEGMKKKGHFQGVPDLSITFAELKRNYRVVADNQKEVRNNIITNKESVAEGAKEDYKLLNSEADKWISVTDKLPKHREERPYDIQLVALENGEVALGVYREDSKEWLTRMNQGELYYANKHNVLAWQPLPQPYKKRKENE